MNFYKRHLGDYARDTAHLSQSQVGTYDLLLDWYYANERPLPLDIDDLRRIARAFTADERRNVDKVLREFFIATDDGYCQKRTDEEIAAWRRQCEINREMGKRGGRPKGSGRKSNGNRIGFNSETETEPNDNPSQNPEARKEQDQEQKPRSVAVSVAATVGDEAADPPRSSGSSSDAPELELVEPPSDDAEAHMISITGARVPLPRSTLDRMAEAYPLVDVRAAVKRAGLWLDANPKRRPTPGGMLRFLTTWLGRDQQRASESNVRGYQSARVIDGGRRESLCERAARLGAEGDAREARRAGALVAIGGGRA